MTQDLNETLTQDDVKPVFKQRIGSPRSSMTEHSVVSSTNAVNHHQHGISAVFHDYHAAAAAAAVHHHSNSLHNGSRSPPFLLPAEIYKSLFASAVLQKRQSSPSPSPPASFPRNLLFSCPSDKQQLGQQDNITSELPVNDHRNSKSYLWANDSAVTSSNLSNSACIVNNSGTSPSEANQQATSSTTDQSNSDKPTSNSPIVAATSTTIQSPTSSNLICGSNTNQSAMPVHQGQNPTQGLVHWMSAVMAEHIQGNTHHDPTVGMHYMWNGGVDQCGQHSKDIDYSGWPPAPRNHMSMKQGYEAKMNDHHNNLQKGHILDDGRLDHHPQASTQMAIYGATTGLRPTSSSSNSPGNHHANAAAAAAALLVVPQPINATKMGSGLTNGGTGRKYQCKMCPQIFSSKADLQMHTQIHMREAKPYKCSQCSKAFANSSYLSQHTRIHLGIKPYRCEICQRKFTQLSHLQQHIRTHTGDKPYKCRHPGCQKAFSQLSNLQSHSRCHQTDKPFKCNSCYKCFSDEPSLLEHIPKHKESKHLKTHICQYCGKSYTQETYLTKHMQKHAERTDKRPPITTGMPTSSNNQSGNGVNNSATGSNVNRNLGLNTNISGATGEHPYWPKVSPDSQASLTDVMHQQQTQQHQQQQQQQGHHDFPPLNQQQQQHSQTADIQAHHRMLDTGSRDEVATTPTGSVVGSYDASSITKTTSNSAFTPINSMVSPHLNMHPMQRPYLYDAISFPNTKNVNQNTTAAANTFPNQLISLHQIRNYAHQPSGLMAGEHLLGVSVGAGK